MKKSLYSRVSIPLIVAMSMVMGVQWLLVSVSLDSLVERYIASRLEHDADNLLANLQFQSTHMELPDHAVDPIYRQPWSGHYYQVIDRNHRIRSRSLWDKELPVESRLPGERRVSRLQGPDGKPLLALVNGYRKRGLAITVVVAEDFQEASRILKILRVLYGGVSFGALLLLLVLTRRYLHRGLEPLKSAKAHIEALERGEREHLAPEDFPLEVRPFVDEINRLLAVLIRRLQRSREAAGDLGHAIKTPLSLLSRLENNPTITSKPELRERLTTQVEAIRKLIKRELGLARLSGGRGSGQWIAVGQDISSLIEVMRQVHQGKGLSIRVNMVPDLKVNLDREDFMTLIGNLLDNACRHADQIVHLSLTRDENNLSAIVEDDGPGIPESKREALIQRGVHSQHHDQGHGLGLSICSEIVKDHQGSMSLMKSETLGGLSVVLRFPPSHGRFESE